MPNEAHTRAKFVRDHQLQGGTFAEAVNIWNGSAEIADTFVIEGVQADDLSIGEIRDAVTDWRMLRALGL